MHGTTLKITSPYVCHTKTEARNIGNFLPVRCSRGGSTAAIHVCLVTVGR